MWNWPCHFRGEGTPVYSMICVCLCLCVCGGVGVCALFTDLQKPHGIILFQTTKRQKEIAVTVKMIMMEATGMEMVGNIDKLLLNINTSIFTAPNVRVCVQQYKHC